MFAEGASLVERYALAKAAGFKAVETGFPLGFSIDQVREAKTQAGVEQVLINIKTGIHESFFTFSPIILSSFSYLSFLLNKWLIVFLACVLWAIEQWLTQLFE